MNIAWGIVVAQIALLFFACILLGFSLLTAVTNRARHSVYRKLAISLLLLVGFLITPMIALHSLVIGLADHLLVFGIPLITTLIAISIVGRAKSKKHAYLHPPAA